MKNFKQAIIVGCGFAGSVIARFLAEECNKKVLIIERRNHIGGNMYDYIDKSGIRVQLYGPHIFHTNEKKLYDFICHYGKWEKYKLNCMAEIDKKCTPTPFNFQTIDDFYSLQKAEKIKNRIKEKYGEKKSDTIVNLLKSDDEVIAEYAKMLFDKDYSLYTAKQWGITPAEIDISVLNRVPVMFSYDVGYFTDKYQVMPAEGFTSIFENILSHPNIEIQLNVDAKTMLKIDNNILYMNGDKCESLVIYTGALDEFFNYKHGLLPYRSLRFEYKTLEQQSYQPAPVVAYPQAESYTRITEYTKLPVQNVGEKTCIAIEYPLQYLPETNAEPYYPIITKKNTELYSRYHNDAKKIKNLILCGRLADYKYYNMDQVLECALFVCEELRFLKK